LTSAANDSTDELTSRLITIGVLRTVLSSARHGALDIDWRTHLIAHADQPIPDLDDRHQQMVTRAITEIANIPNQAWEPDMKVGWREALEAWFAATKQAIDEALDIQRRIHQAANQSARYT
jgi:hypothetical protein